MKIYCVRVNKVRLDFLVMDSLSSLRDDCRRCCNFLGVNKCEQCEKTFMNQRKKWSFLERFPQWSGDGDFKRNSFLLILSFVVVRLEMLLKVSRVGKQLEESLNNNKVLGQKIFF